MGKHHEKNNKNSWRSLFGGGVILLSPRVGFFLLWRGWWNPDVFRPGAQPGKTRDVALDAPLQAPANAWEISQKKWLIT